jgi:N6-L-threonylcarbamoyladenine synthase
LWGRYLDPMRQVASGAADYSSGTHPATEGPAPGASLVVLGLETSCDETAASVVRLTPDGTATVLSSVVHSQIDDHAAYGGVVPEIAARSHVEMIAGVTRRAMAEAGLGYDGLDGIAATAGPGLVGGVMVGLAFGKAVRWRAACRSSGSTIWRATRSRPGWARDVAYPFLLLLVSGGHCQLLEVRGIGACSRWAPPSTTRPARPSTRSPRPGLGYPAGRRWKSWRRAATRARFDLPRALLGRKDCDFSFSGSRPPPRVAETCETDRTARDLADAVQSAIARQLSERSTGR